MNLEDAWALAYRGARSAGSLEPEDAAQTVFLGILESPRRPSPLERDCPPAYWLVAGRNEARNQWEQRRWLAPMPDELSSGHFEVEEAVMNALTLQSLPPWAMEIAQREVCLPAKRRHGYRRTPRIRAMLARMM